MGLDEADLTVEDQDSVYLTKGIMFGTIGSNHDHQLKYPSGYIIISELEILVEYWRYR